MNTLITRHKTLLFTISFWFIASLVLFVERYQIAQHHLNVAYIRCAYLWLVGVLISFVLVSFFNSELFKGTIIKPKWWVITSSVAAIVTALLLNPVTYLMTGYDIENVPVEIFSTGTLYFFLFYLLWSIFYFKWSFASSALIDVNELSLEDAPGSSDNHVFNVEKMGEKRLLNDIDICCIRASGDYVELITENNCYMIKNTLKKLDQQLNNSHFKRVHRSTIVNSNKVKSVIPKQSGAFEITLNGGYQILSSRSYKSVVEGLYPTA